MRWRRPTRSAAALETIARVRPKMLVINGGDGTVQAALTELYNGGHFGNEPPPVAVLPSGRTNLIALDLGAQGDPIAALEKLLEIAQSDLEPAHRRPRNDRAALRNGRADAGDRHVPRRGGARRHDPLLPRKDLPARPAQRSQPRDHRAGAAGSAAAEAQERLPAAASEPARRVDGATARASRDAFPCWR